MTQEILNPGKLPAWFFLALLTLPGLTQAQQLESPVACVEGAEPLSLVYGDHTTGCEIDPATDLDRFEFCGLTGDEVRINVHAPANFMDPDLVIRDPMTTIIATQSCNDFCSFTTDLVLAIDGCYTLFVSDVANNETGGYSLQIEKIVPTPAAAVHVNFDETQSDTIDPSTDVDFYTFNGTAGTDIRLNVLSAANFMDPTVEIRDPGGAVIIDGPLDGASCNDFCSFSVDLSPAVSGTYSLIIYDRLTNETGDYEFSLWCLSGPCDSDADGTPDPVGPLVSYVSQQSGTIETGVDGDFYTFNGTAGTDIRLNVLSAANFMDPTVEIRDPGGAIIIDGPLDGASCNDFCSFSVDLSPAVSGTYSLIIYDRLTNETGDYEFSLWCLSGPCDSDADGTPDPAVPFVSYVSQRFESIETGVDGDFYTINGTAGTDIRLNVLAAGNFMDPTVEIRDPSGTVLVDGVADGASCNDFCSFSVNLTPAVSGPLRVLVYDRATNEAGTYDLSLWCLNGPCDSDADGVIDGNPPVSLVTPAVLAYEVPVMDEIDSEVDSDIFLFGGNAGDLIRFNVLATGNFMDPTIEIRDPTGTVVINGLADGASCNDFCSYSFDLSPAMTGTYSLMLYDLTTNESGTYELSLQCLIGVCADAVAMCGDNCIDAANGPLIPDAGGNVQRDTNGDGYGNVCDPDLDNNNVVNFLDVSDFSDVFLSSDPDADLDGNGFVNFLDFFILTELFLEPPGPSCTLPALP